MIFNVAGADRTVIWDERAQLRSAAVADPVGTRPRVPGRSVDSACPHLPVVHAGDRRTATRGAHPAYATRVADFARIVRLSTGEVTRWRG